jgi:hypothetical protein
MDHSSAQLSWRDPEFQAAAITGVLILIVPLVVGTYLDYTWDAVRPFQPTVLSSAIRTLPIVAGLIPVAMLVGWRSYAHARRYRVRRSTVWQGPLESAAIAGGIALLVMLATTAHIWHRQPIHLVVGYIGIYVGATALVGLLLGLVLAAIALLVLHVRAGQRS